MTLQTEIQNLPDTEFRDLKAWIVTTETDRRAAQPAIEEAQAQLVEELWEARPELKPVAGITEITPAETAEALVAQVKQWAQPATPLDGYPRSELAALGGRVWRNRRPGNMKQPGEPFSGWEDVTDDYLKLADAVDGNAPGVGTDAPGLITEPKPKPEPEVTPAPQVQEWYVGAKIDAGIPWLHDGQVYIAKVNHTASATNAPGKSTRHWQLLPA